MMARPGRPAACGHACRAGPGRNAEAAAKPAAATRRAKFLVKPAKEQGIAPKGAPGCFREMPGPG